MPYLPQFGLQVFHSKARLLGSLYSPPKKLFKPIQALYKSLLVGALGCPQPPSFLVYPHKKSVLSHKEALCWATSIGSGPGLAEPCAPFLGEFSEHLLTHIVPCCVVESIIKPWIRFNAKFHPKRVFEFCELTQFISNYQLVFASKGLGRRQTYTSSNA